VFSKASFHVDITEKGIAAMEKIMRNPPAVALINVNLKDITGELVVLRLQRMVKLKNVKFLLFEHQERSEYSTDRTILKYKNPQELLEEVKNITAVESKILHLN
jgi:DNA-binding response OmpR family regulator